jgi:actin-related protein
MSQVKSSTSLSDDVVAIVIDMGTSLCRAGYSGEEIPRTIFPNVVGRRNRESDTKTEKSAVNFCVGDEAILKKSTHQLKLSRPIERGVVRNWDDVENILGYTISHELQAEPEDHPLLITEVPLSPKSNREKMAELIFEDFKCPALFFGNQGMLSLFAANVSTGLSLSIGEGVTHMVPVSDGHPLVHATVRLGFGGQDITDYLLTLLTEQGHSFTTTEDRGHINTVKEKYSYVSFDSKAELAAVRSKEEEIDKTYELPNGEKIVVGEERFRCTEVLFNQSLVGMDLYEGIHDMTYKAVTKCDMVLRRHMLENIVLSGGTTLCPGLQDRLEKEVQLLAPDTLNVRVVAEPQRQHACWVGGAIYASLSTFDKLCISRDSYEEYGPNVTHTKGFC